MSVNVKTDTNSMQVRQATNSDIPWIISELKAFSSFYGGKIPVFGNQEHMENLVETLIQTHVMLICDDNDTKLGFIGGFLGPHLFNPAIRVLTELCWWVPERHRGTKAGSLLLDAFQEFGKKHANWVTMTLEADSPVPEIILIKRGFTLKERNFYMENE